MYVIIRKYTKSNGEVVVKTYNYTPKVRTGPKKPKRTKWDIKLYNSNYYQKNREELLEKMRYRRPKKNFYATRPRGSSRKCVPFVNPKKKIEGDIIQTITKKTNLIVVSF